MDTFITVAEAVKLTGKSRRTITRLATRLAKTGSDQVIREKTPRGYIWRITQQSLQAAFGMTTSPTVTTSEHDSAQQLVHVNSEYILEVAHQGYAGIMTMHQEVKQAYEALLAEKDQRITALSQQLAQTKKSFWTQLFGS